MSRGRSGFSKDCNCCRESGYKERTITLRSCYDMDGHKLEEGSQASMQVPGHASRVTCHVSRVTCHDITAAGDHQGAERVPVLQVRVSSAVILIVIVILCEQCQK